MCNGSREQVVLVGACSWLGLACFLYYSNDIVVLGDTAAYHHTGSSYRFVVAVSPHLGRCSYFFSLLWHLKTCGFFFYDIFCGIWLAFSFFSYNIFMTFGEVSWKRKSLNIIIIKQQFENDNFTNSKVTTNYAKFCPSLITVYMLFVIMTGNCMVKSTMILCGVYH